MQQTAKDDSGTEFDFRHPQVADGLRIWRLIREAGTLDLNSTYAYLVLCRDFADTCLLAEHDGRLDGFVTGYLPPKHPNTLFIWQIGVAPAARGKGLASQLLENLLQSESCRHVNSLITNVTPSNKASRALFARLARALETELTEDDGFGEALFPEPGHEPERLLHIGPFSVSTLSSTPRNS
jgi:L-2,4-diaminobutyric acid acetyltransferase